MQTAITSVTTTITGAFKTISSKFDELCKWWADFSIVGTGKSIVTSFLKGIQDKYNNSTFRQSISDAIEHFTGDGSGDRGAAKRKKEKFAGRGSTTSGKDEMGAFNVNLFSGGGAGDTPDTENGFSYYSQNDSAWKGSQYGTDDGMGNFGDTGCGPTAMAMVASNITGQAVSPTDMANFATNNGYRVPGGTDEGMFSDAASQMGINSVPLAGKDNTISIVSSEISHVSWRNGLTSYI
jgi:hypothetical protein